MENAERINLMSDPTQLAKQLGYAGLLPFVTLTLMLWFADADFGGAVAMALAGYGAVIASFLGGVHWGIAQCLPANAARFHTLWGVVPSLMAWVSMIMPRSVQLPLIALVLLVCYVVDRRNYPRVGLAAWLPMRLRLSAVAILSCVLGAAKVLSQ